MAKRPARSPSRPYNSYFIYGDSGAGKSTMAATFPKPMIVFMFDPPRGKAFPYYKKGEPGDIENTPSGHQIQSVYSRKSGDEIIRLEIFGDTDPKRPRAHERFERRLRGLDDDAAWVETIVVDSVTHYALAARKRHQYMLTKGKDPRRWFAAATDSLEEVLEIQLVNTWQKNLVVIAHVGKEKVIHGETIFTPQAPGRLATNLPAAFGEVYRAYVVTSRTGDPDYLVQTEIDEDFVAQTHIDAPSPCDQTYKALWENWEG